MPKPKSKTIPLPPGILESLRGKKTKIKNELKKDSSSIFLRLTMPLQLLVGTFTKGEGDASSIFTSHGKTFNIGETGKFTKDGILLPRSMLRTITHSIKNLYLPGGSPNEESIKVLGESETSSNASILVLPVLPGERGAKIVSHILGEISGTLGLSVILVETEPDGIVSYGSVLVEGYRFAYELLEKRLATTKKPMIVLPTNRMIQEGFTKDILKGLRSTIVGGEESVYWATFGKRQSYDMVLKSIGLPGTRATIFATSSPFEYEGINIMVIRARVSGDVSYPSSMHVKKYEDVTKIRSVLEKYRIANKDIEFVIRSLPGLPKCYSHNYICSWLSKSFETIRRLKIKFTTKCEIMKELFVGNVVCEYTIQEDDLPEIPTKRRKVELHILPSVGSDVLFKNKIYTLVSVDKKAGLAMLLGEDGMMRDRVVVPYSYLLLVKKDKKINPTYLLPGFGTTEYLTISLVNDDDKTITLKDICCMERSFFMKNNAPFWKGEQCKLEWDGSRWVLTVKDTECRIDNPEKIWSMGWTGTYTSGDKSYIVGERHGSILDGSRQFIQNTSVVTHKGNVLFLGKPEYLGDEKEYMCLRLAIFSLLANKQKKRLSLYNMKGKRGNIQEKWAVYLLNFLTGGDHKLRYIVDDIGIQELCEEVEKISMTKFHSFTGPPVSNVGEYKPVTTNEDLKMSQFVTYMGNTEQLYSYGWKPWAASGPPRILYKHKHKVSKYLFNILKKIKSDANIDMYKDITPEAVSWAMRYTFHKLRTGILVSIRSNGVNSFIPMVNLDYNNVYKRSGEFWFGKDMTQTKYLKIKNKVLKEMGLRQESFAPRQKWFVNNSLIGNMKSTGVNDVFAMIALHLIQETLRNNQVNDCDFILNVRDFPKLRRDGRDPDHAVHGVRVDGTPPIMDGFEKSKTIPFLSFNTHEQYADLPFVDPDTWINSYGGYIGNKGNSSSLEIGDWKVKEDVWKERKGKAIFRGSATGYGSTTSDNQRLMFAEMFQRDMVFVDYAITSGAVRDRKTSNDGMRYIVPKDIADVVPESKATTRARIQPKKKMKLFTTKEEYGIRKFTESQDQNRMVLYIDGNAAAYRYTSLMREGFCILKVNSMIGYNLWLYPSLKEALPGSDKEGFEEKTDDEITKLFNKSGDHIKVDKEGKNLIRILKWANSSDVAIEMTRIIAKNAVRLYNSICSRKSLMFLTAKTLNMISENQKWSVRHSASKKDIDIPKSTKTIIKTLAKVATVEREREDILPEPIVIKEMVPKMTRPSISSISKEKSKQTLPDVIEKVKTEMGEEGKERVSSSKPRKDRTVSSKIVKDIETSSKRLKHSAIHYLTRKIPKRSLDFDLSELI